MKFRSESFIAHPREAVFTTYRDKLADVVAFLDDIKQVNVLDRTEKGDTVVLHNEWVSDREIPSVAQAFLKPEQMRWDDYATWDAASYTCTFEIKTRAFTDAVRCVGGDTFLEVDGGTKVILEGDFDVNVTSLPGVPSFLAKRVVPQVEKFIIALIQPNLEKVNEAIGRYLDAQG
ncbi:MAG: hypothetical protein H6733_05775 [Alphaproteobacteria bacterium]|nr:hypothetical protein [Alphaproteobacteria bacterium]